MRVYAVVVYEEEMPSVQIYRARAHLRPQLPRRFQVNKQIQQEGVYLHKHLRTAEIIWYRKDV